MHNHILVEKNNAIWKFTLNRPQALNALNTDLLKELSQLVQEASLAFPDQCRALILTGSGDKSFVAGADIKEMKDLSPEQAREFSERGQSIFKQLESLPFPVLAAVNGFALGGGLELAMACDFIFCSDNARMGLPEVSLGLIPGFGGTHRLARLVGVNRARQMIYSGQIIKAEEAYRIGLVNQIYSQVELISEANKFLEIILSQGPLAVRSAKETVLKSCDLSVSEALDLEAKKFGELFQTKDMREGTAAFDQKRKAQFQGK